MAPVAGTDLSTWSTRTGICSETERRTISATSRAGSPLPLRRGPGHRGHAATGLSADPRGRSELGRRAEGGAGQAADASGCADGPRERDAGRADPPRGGAEAGAIPNTKLSWVTNTGATWSARPTDARFYYLVAGRWVRADKRTGLGASRRRSWTSRGSPNHPGAMSSAGCRHRQAQEAVIEGHIPQTAGSIGRRCAAHRELSGDARVEAHRGDAAGVAASSRTTS